MIDDIPDYERVSEKDLQWWYERADDLRWLGAKSYRSYAPHSYVALRQHQLSRDNFIRAARVIQTYGEPGRYRGYTNIYLKSPDGRYKWWIMDRIEDCDLINRSDADQWYGVQDAPRTYYPEHTEYDSIATVYDRYRDREFDGKIRRRLLEVFPDSNPTVLDVGCGTGALLDLRKTTTTQVVDPDRYTGIDCSQGMLNQLVLKHPRVQRLIPARFEEVTDLEPQYDVVVAVEVPGIDLDRCRELAKKLLIVRMPTFVTPPL